MGKNVEKEFIELIRQNERVIYKVCSFYASPQAPADDLYQETVVNLWRAWPRFRAEAAVSTWIYRVALNTCISYMRREKKHPRGVPVPDVPEPPDDGGDERLATLYRLIGMLNKMDKAVVLLYLEGSSNAEIATITGLSPGNVAVRLTRIRDKMKTLKQ